MYNYHPIYFDINDWTILDNLIIHDYSESEYPIEIIEVQVGNLIYKNIKNGKYYTPITRWITKKEYNRLLKNEGTIIW